MTGKRMGILVAAAALMALPGCHRNTEAAAGGSVEAMRSSRWTLVELNGRPASTGAGGEAATLQITADRASGFAGCNRFSSTYEMSGAALRFTAPVSTRMACAAGMELERSRGDPVSNRVAEVGRWHSGSFAIKAGWSGWWWT